MIIGYYLATHTEQGGTAGVSVDPTEWNSPRYSYTDGSFIGRQSSSRTVAALPLGNSSPRFATTKVTQRQCFFPCRYTTLSNLFFRRYARVTGDAIFKWSGICDYAFSIGCYKRFFKYLCVTYSPLWLRSNRRSLDP